MKIKLVNRTKFQNGNKRINIRKNIQIKLRSSSTLKTKLVFSPFLEENRGERYFPCVQHF